MGDIYLSGLASGLDWDALLEKLMAVERRPLIQLQDKQKALDTRKNAWHDVNTRLLNLQTEAEELKTRDTFYSKAASTGDASVVTATASSSAGIGAYQVEVVRLAKAHTVTSAAQASSTTALGISGNPTINGKVVSISATDTLTSIRDRINSIAGINVTASVIQVTPTQYKLVITSTNTGASNAMNIVDDSNAFLTLGVFTAPGTLNTVQAAQDSEVRVNSLTISRSTNTITDAVAGLTLELKKESATTTVTVNHDVEKVVKAVRDFADQYNSVQDFIESKMSYDSETKIAGPLLGDTSLMLLQSRLRQLVTGTVPGLPSTLNSAALVGVKTGAFGSGNENRLEVDETLLRDKLAADLDGVAKVFGAYNVNVALATAGATATGLTEGGAPNEGSPAEYGAANVINGDTSSDRWGSAGGGWMDSTPSAYPDMLEINFGAQKTIDEVRVFTLNSTTYPAATYGLKDYKLQWWDGVSWQDLETITGNVNGVVIHEFEAKTTQKIRLNITATNGANDYSRVVEVEAFQRNEGVGSRLVRELDAYTKSGGILEEKEDTLGDQSERIADRIKLMEERLARREENMRKEFIALEQAMMKLNNQGAWLTSQISTLQNNWLSSIGD